MTACIQSVAMFGSELWWIGDHTRGYRRLDKRASATYWSTKKRERRVTTGWFRTTNLGALLMESGPGAATTQLENRQRRFGTSDYGYSACCREIRRGR